MCSLRAAVLCALALTVGWASPSLGQVAPLPLESLPVGQWYEIPNSRLDAVLPSPIPPGGMTGPSAIISAWNSAALDTKRHQLLVHGGGHADYPGNEVYAFSLDTLTWQLLVPPSYSYPIPGQDQSVYPDGTPASVHTYGGLVYAPNADRLIRIGGSKWGGGGGPSPATWSLNLDTKAWMGKAAIPSQWFLGETATYDPGTGLIWHRAYNTVQIYNPVTDQWTDNVSVTDAGINDGFSAVIDPKRRLLLLIGAFMFLVYHLDNPLQPEVWTTTGANQIVNTYAPGLVYDPVLDGIVAWNGGSTVYLLNPDTRVWATVVGTGAVPPPAQPAGTWGRFVYSPADNVYLVVNAIDQNVFAFRLSGATPAPTPAPAPTPTPAPSATPTPVSPTLVANPSSARPGDTETVTLTSGLGNARDWIGLYTISSPDNAPLDWLYLNGSKMPPSSGLTSAVLSFALPGVARAYNFRFFGNDSYQLLATSNQVVLAQVATVTATPSSVSLGGAIRVSVAQGPGHRTDWVGIYRADQSDLQYLDWFYLNGSKSAPVSGLTSATVMFTAPPSSGTYNFRFFVNDGFTLVATSNPVSVLALAPTPTPAPSATPIVTPGGLTLPPQTWVPQPLPAIGQGPMPTQGKHARLLFDSRRKRMVLAGGDWYTAANLSDPNGQSETWSIDLASLSAGWTKEYPYCGPAGDSQPARPDEVTWVYDSVRDLYWMMPGYFFDQVLQYAACGGPPASAEAFNWMYGFNPVTKKWTRVDVSQPAPYNIPWPPPEGVPGDTNAKHGVYDPTTDSIYRFYRDGAWGQKIQILHLATASWDFVGLGWNPSQPYDEVQRNLHAEMEYEAIDVAGRVVYSLDPFLKKLMSYNIITGYSTQRVTLSDLPAAYVVETGIGVQGRSMMVFDPANRVLLLPNMPNLGGEILRLFIYHVDTGIWETEEIPNLGIVNGHAVMGNVVGFDEANNALLLIGGHATGPSLLDPSRQTQDPTVFWLYRYGNGPSKP